MSGEPSKSFEEALSKAKARSNPDRVKREVELFNCGIIRPHVLRPSPSRRSLPVPRTPPQAHFSEVETPRVIPETGGTGWTVVNE
jgi:hypothetical protein